MFQNVAKYYKPNCSKAASSFQKLMARAVRYQESQVLRGDRPSKVFILSTFHLLFVLAPEL
jgi:hypothetical protein